MLLCIQNFIFIIINNKILFLFKFVENHMILFIVNNHVLKLNKRKVQFKYVYLFHPLYIFTLVGTFVIPRGRGSTPLIQDQAYVNI